MATRAANSTTSRARYAAARVTLPPDRGRRTGRARSSAARPCRRASRSRHSSAACWRTASRRRTASDSRGCAAGAALTQASSNPLISIRPVDPVHNADPPPAICWIACPICTRAFSIADASRDRSSKSGHWIRDLPSRGPRCPPSANNSSRVFEIYHAARAAAAPHRRNHLVQAHYRSGCSMRIPSPG